MSKLVESEEGVQAGDFSGFINWGIFLVWVIWAESYPLFDKFCFLGFDLLEYDLLAINIACGL